MIQQHQKFQLYALCLLFLFLCSCSSIESQKANKEAAFCNIRLGLAYLEANQYELAKSKLLLALKEDPKNSLAYDAYGYFLEQNSEEKRAEYYYHQAIKIATFENKGIAYNNYGTYLYRQRRFQESLKYFLLAIKEPNYLEIASAYENAGNAALRDHKYRLAKSYFQKARGMKP